MISKELKTTQNLVQHILEENSEARNSDDLLKYCVYKSIATKKGINIDSISLKDALIRRKEFGFPSSETIRRTRQKLQASFPELAGCDEVEGHRILNEETFKDYARKKW